MFFLVTKNKTMESHPNIPSGNKKQKLIVSKCLDCDIFFVQISFYFMWGNNQSIVNALQKTEAMDVENTEAATAVAPSS